MSTEYVVEGPTWPVHLTSEQCEYLLRLMGPSVDDPGSPAFLLEREFLAAQESITPGGAEPEQRCRKCGHGPYSPCEGSFDRALAENHGDVVGGLCGLCRRGEPTISNAVAEFGPLCPDMWSEVGGAFTCSEANALVALLGAVGLTAHAEALAQCHEAGDFEGDEHWTGTDPE